MRPMDKISRRDLAKLAAGVAAARALPLVRAGARRARLHRSADRGGEGD